MSRQFLKIPILFHLTDLLENIYGLYEVVGGPLSVRVVTGPTEGPLQSLDVLITGLDRSATHFLAEASYTNVVKTNSYFYSWDQYDMGALAFLLVHLGTLPIHCR